MYNNNTYTGKAWCNKIGWILVGFGGLLVIAGGLILVISWDSGYLQDVLGLSNNTDYEEIFNAIHSAQFIEFFLPGLVGMIFAADLMQLLLNDENKRMLYLTVPFAVGGLYGGVIYAYIINWEPKADPTYKFYQYDQVACISAGYFIFGLMCIARILVEKEKIKIDDPAKATLYKFLISCLIAFGGFLCAVGM